MFRTQLLHKSNGGIPGRCFFGLVGGEGRGGSGKSYMLASMAKLTMVMIVITENIAFYNGTDTYYHRSGHLFPVIARCPCGEVTTTTTTTTIMPPTPSNHCSVVLARLDWPPLMS